MRIAAALLLLVCSACAGTARSPRETPADPAAREVIRTTQRLFDAMAARDTTALRELLHPEARIISIRGGRVGVQEGRKWVPNVGRSEETLRERMWNPHVQVAGEIATLTAPYDFHLGQRFSHCGTDAFQFVRDGERWRLIAVTFTVQTEGCETAPER